MYYLYSENKGADQLRGHREADLRLCFCTCKKPGFLRCGSFKQPTKLTCSDQTEADRAFVLRICMSHLFDDEVPLVRSGDVVIFYVALGTTLPRFSYNTTHLYLLTLVFYFQLIFGAMRVGGMASFMSDPFISGFTTGAACHVFSSQIKHIFGVHVHYYHGPLALVYVSSILLFYGQLQFHDNYQSVYRTILRFFHFLTILQIDLITCNKGM